MKNFVTIDFETASRYEYSPCSVSVYEFENNNYRKLLSTLINPGDGFFDPYLTTIHGITKNMVQNSPKINDVLQYICNLIENKMIFAHNAPFDISKIIDGCNLYNIKIPNFEYADSIMVAKRTWPNLVNYKLDTVSEFLQISLNHHNADSDAFACGKIVLEALKAHNLDDIDILLENIKYSKGYYQNNQFISAHSRPLTTSKKKNNYNVLNNISVNTLANSNILGKYFVFTGALSLKRADAMQIVASKGAIPEANITRNTNYLVVGRDDYGNFKLGNKSNKMIKAEELIQKGQNLEIISEDDFLEMIN